MKGIMRKKLLGLLSVVGLASSSTPASTQVLKGSQPADTKAESAIKASKTRKEDAASKDAAKMTKVANERKAVGIQADDKRKLSSVEGGHATSDVITEKQRKAGGTQMGDGSVKPTNTQTIGSATGGAGAGKAKFNELHVKGGKSAAETNAATGDHIKKAKNNAAEAQAAQQDANKKAAKQADQPK